MLYLKCTGEVQKALRLDKKNLSEAEASTAPLGSWYVHRFAIGRTRFFLFMSEATLLSFVLYQGKKAVSATTLPTMFMAGLHQLLSMRGIEASAIERALEPYHVGLFARTDSRKSLGSMNDLVRCYTTIVEAQGGLQSCDLTATIMRINDMPQRTLGWGTSWEMTEAVLQATQAPKH